MSFWDNDEANRRAAARREEEAELRRADDKRRKERAKLARKQEVTRQKEQKLLRAQQAAEDKKLRDELMEKMIGAVKGTSETKKTQMPSLNRGLGGDRATPSQQTFQHLKPPPGSHQMGAGSPRSKVDESRETQKTAGASSSHPPLKRPF